MNQFDELFGKKLNEEQSFGGQKRSWTQLSRDLNTFEVGASVAAKSLALWKAVSVVALLSSVALLWERQHLVRENEQLKKMPLQELPVSPPSKQDIASTPDQTTTKAAFNTQISSTQSVQQERTPADVTTTPVPSFLQNRKTVSAKSSVSSTTLPGAASGKIAEAALPHPVEAGSEKQNENIGFDKKVNSPVEKTDNILVTNDLSDLSDSISLADNSALSVQNTPGKVDSVQQKTPEKPDSMQLAPVVSASPVIDPVVSRPSRFRAGIRMSLGYHLPLEKGLSLVKGQGIGLLYRVWNNFSVTAAADFMQYDVNTDTIPKHYCSLKLPPPGPGHHFFDLENVSSNQSMQQYSLGMRYSFKLFGPLRLSANAAHTWVHHPSRLTSLRFEEMPHGGGGPGHPDDEYLSIQSVKSWERNIWRLGLGVQYETPRWAFGINGDYSKKLNNSKPSFDTAYASAEIMYKF